MSKKTQVVQNNFTRIYDPIMMATEVLNTLTGVVIELNVYDKLVYSYIWQQSEWFKSYGKLLFESQDSIARAFGFDRKTVNKSISRLEDVGAITKTKQQVGGVWKTTYTASQICKHPFKLSSELTYREYKQKPRRELVEIIVKDIGCVAKITPQNVLVENDFNDEEF